MTKRYNHQAFLYQRLIPGNVQLSLILSGDKCKFGEMKKSPFDLAWETSRRKSTASTRK